MKKRPLTLTAGILGTVVSAINVVISLIAVLLGGALTGAVSEAAGAEAGAIMGITLVILIISLAFSVVALIMNAMSISGFSATPEKYRKKRGVIITAIVFNILSAIFCIISFSIINLLFFLVYLASAVLFIVDLCLEKKRVEGATAQNTTENK